MARIFGIGNKKGAGGSVPGGGSGATNSETDSETLKALEEVNIRLKERKIKNAPPQDHNIHFFSVKKLLHILIFQKIIRV